jgi:hypothetical protein
LPSIDTDFDFGIPYNPASLTGIIFDLEDQVPSIDTLET